MSILVCAATAAEAWGCRKGIAESGLLATDFEILQTGMGMKAARAALHRYLSEMRKTKGDEFFPRLIISAGFAGVWKGSFPLGSWVSSSQIWIQDEQKVATLVPLPLVLPIPSVECVAPLVSVEKIQKLPSNLPSELASHSVVVDMESAALLRVASEFKISFGVLRMITDTPEQPLPEFVSSWASAILAGELEDKIKLGGRGLFEVFKEPAAVFKLMQDGKKWSEFLIQGWKQKAPLIAQNV